MYLNEFLNKKMTLEYVNNILKKYDSDFKIVDITKYQQTFIHRSCHDINKENFIYSFDRLKFLGDSVIRLILTEYLFDRYKEDEGFLTKLRTKLENNITLSKISHILSLNEYIIIDNNMMDNNAVDDLTNNSKLDMNELELNNSNICGNHTDTKFNLKYYSGEISDIHILNEIKNIDMTDNIENNVKSLCDDDSSLQKICKTNYKLIMGELIKSFMGILYLDSSFSVCKKFFINVIEREIDMAEMLYYDINYKDKLLQYYHKMKWKDPSYDVIENANDNHEKIYIVGAKSGTGEKIIGLGFGTTKLQAEQLSAKYSLAYYNVNYECDNKISTKSINNEMDELIPYLLNPKNCHINIENVHDIFKIYNCDIIIKNINWYKQAMVHKSYTYDNSKKNKICKKLIYSRNIQPIDENIPHIKIQKRSYERLEFLGDSVIRLILSEYIYNRYENQSEGFMTKLRTNIENGKILGSLAQKINLNNFLIISKIEEINNGRNGKIDILGDIFESFFGALYKDKNIDECTLFFTKIIEHEIDFATILFIDTNYKDQLLRIFHSKKFLDPKYELINIKSHYDIKSHYENDIQMENYYDDTIYKHKNNNNTKCFHVALINNNKIISEGFGYSKLMAEQNAAKNAIINESYNY